MNKQRLLIFGLVGLFILNLVLLGLLGSVGGPPRLPIPYQGPKHEVIKRLDFSSEQVQQYDLLIKKHQTNINALQRQSKQLKEQLYRTLKTAPSHETDSLISQLGALQSEMEQVHYRHFQEIKELCTPTQVPLFNDLTEDLARYFSPRRRIR